MKTGYKEWKAEKQRRQDPGSHRAKSGSHKSGEEELASVTFQPRPQVLTS